MKPVCIAAALALLAGCSVTPEYQVPEQEMPATYSPQAPALPVTAPGAASRWWETFGSAELDALVDEALVQNQDVRAAVQRIAQARASAAAVTAGWFPTIQGKATDELSYPESGRGTRRVLDQSARSREIGLDASYELDLWGRTGAAADAALANVEASEFDRETVVMTLTSDVALAYLQYLQSLDRARVAQRNIDNMRLVLATVMKRFEIGEGTEFEIAQQRDALAQAEAVVPTYQLAAERSRNRLAVLVGRPPQMLSLAYMTLDTVNIPAIAPGLPSDLLLQRPDVRRAEAGLRAANANIGAARTQLLPRITLTAEAGYASPAISGLMGPQSLFYGAVASLVQVLFDGGRAANDIANNEARFAELAETYRKAVLSSLRDVEDALSQARLMAIKERAQAEALARALEARRLARASYEIGMVDFLNVLESERSVNRSEDELVLTRYSRLEAAVSLYKALGGGTVPRGDLAER